LNSIFAFVKKEMRPLFILFLIVIIAACSKKNLCLRYTTITAKVNFKTITDSNKIKDSIIFLPNYFYPEINAGAFFFKTNKTNVLLNTQLDSTIVIYQADTLNNAKDTILFFHSKQINYISKECGFNYFFNLKNVTYTKHLIKKIEIIDSLINDNANAQNINITF
jgi:Family of unknown function (DUF6452)